MSGTTLLAAGALGVDGTTRYMPPSESILLKLLALNFFMFMGRDCDRHMWSTGSCCLQIITRLIIQIKMTIKLKSTASKETRRNSYGGGTRTC